jgi:hypothetical protein
MLVTRLARASEVPGDTVHEILGSALVGQFGLKDGDIRPVTIHKQSGELVRLIDR